MELEVRPLHDQSKSLPKVVIHSEGRNELVAIAKSVRITSDNTAMIRCEVLECRGFDYKRWEEIELEEGEISDFHGEIRIRQ